MVRNTLNMGNGIRADRWKAGPRKLRVEMSGDFLGPAELIEVLRDIANGLEGGEIDPAMQAANCPFAFLAEETE